MEVDGDSNFRTHSTRTVYIGRGYNVQVAIAVDVFQQHPCGPIRVRGNITTGREVAQTVRVPKPRDVIGHYERRYNVREPVSIYVADGNLPDSSEHSPRRAMQGREGF